MLILSRRLNQAVFIDGRTKVRVLEISPGHVQLGFEAPPDVVVDREEVHLRKQREGAGAATAARG